MQNGAKEESSEVETPIGMDDIRCLKGWKAKDRQSTTEFGKAHKFAR